MTLTVTDTFTSRLNDLRHALRAGSNIQTTRDVLRVLQEEAKNIIRREGSALFAQSEFLTHLAPAARTRATTTFQDVSVYRSNTALTTLDPYKELVSYVLKAGYGLFPFLEKSVLTTYGEQVRLNTHLPLEGLNAQFASEVEAWTARFKYLRVVIASHERNGMPCLRIVVANGNDSALRQNDNAYRNRLDAYNVAQGNPQRRVPERNVLPDRDVVSDLNTLFDFIKEYARYLPCQTVKAS